MRDVERCTQVVAVSGDMLDEGNSCDESEFARASRRFRGILHAAGARDQGQDPAVGGKAGDHEGARPLLMTLGNHDVGLGWEVKI